jgi:hypothetical protein
VSRQADPSDQAEPYERPPTGPVVPMRAPRRADEIVRRHTIIPRSTEKFASQRRHSASLLRPGPGLGEASSEHTVVSTEAIHHRGEEIDPEGWFDLRRT